MKDFGKSNEFFAQHNVPEFWEGFDRLIWISLAAVTLALGRVFIIKILIVTIVTNRYCT